ncbi:MAG: PRC-barrel domain-containing protein [Proteobacteria bacterium]|nr:PRC-barrel domain-containing protein [Pseudomonadota bacterium]
MKNSLIATTSLVALIAFPAFAQQTKSYPNMTEVVPVSSPTPSAATQNLPSGPDMLANKIQGLAVYAPKEGSTSAMSSVAPSKVVSNAEIKSIRDVSHSVGEINDLVIGADGMVKHAVIDVGGFLGIGERPVALPWSEVNLIRTADGEAIAVVRKSKADLEKLTEYKPAK